MRVRFAPSPTGTLHIGSALVAIVNDELARAAGGVMFLRIDDTDGRRTIEGAVEVILHDLSWLGVAIEGPPVLQSTRAGHHRAVAAELLSAGLAERQGDAIVFPVEPRDITVQDAARGAVRFPAGAIGDIVLVRSDGTPAFPLASAVDDIDLAITHVVRGEDHLASSARQLLLAQALGASVPFFAHTPIVVGDDGSRLSKRAGAAAVRDLRDAGFAARAVRRWLLDLAGGPPLERLHRGTVQADIGQLESLSRAALKQMPTDELLEAVSRRLGASVDQVALARLMPGLSGLATLAEMTEEARAVLVSSAVAAPLPADLSSALADALAAESGPVALEEADRMLSTLVLLSGRARGAVLKAIRVALTGREHGVPLRYVLTALPRSEIRRRITGNP